MSFIKKTWLSRIVEYPTRRLLTKTNGSTEVVTVARDEGTIAQEGDSFSTTNMNDLEARISNAFEEVYNPNLIDNPWFTINQRGQTSYTAKTYTVDRWVFNYANTKIDVVDGGITYSKTTSGIGSLCQWCGNYDKLLGKTLTLSVMLSNGSVKSATFTMPDTLVTSDGDRGAVILNDAKTFYAYIRLYTTGKMRCDIYNNANFDITQTYTIRAVKLEIGSTSTLANDIPPNYAEELQKCCISTADSSDTYANQPTNIEIRYNPTTNAPEWSVRGADTYSPFSSGFENCEILYSGYNYNGGSTVTGTATKDEGILIGLTNSYYSKVVDVTGDYDEIMSYGSSANGNTLLAKAVICNSETSMTVTGMSGASRGSATVIIVWVH